MSLASRSVGKEVARYSGDTGVNGSFPETLEKAALQQTMHS